MLQVLSSSSELIKKPSLKVQDSVLTPETVTHQLTFPPGQEFCLPLSSTCSHVAAVPCPYRNDLLSFLLVQEYGTSCRSSICTTSSPVHVGVFTFFLFFYLFKSAAVPLLWVILTELNPSKNWKPSGLRHKRLSWADHTRCELLNCCGDGNIEDKRYILLKKYC